MSCQRNSLMPIASLPPEILGGIFAFVQVRDVDDRGRRIEPLCWIALTHVCRRWRDIALDLPTLWVDLPIDYPEWVEEMIYRSNECSFIVDAVISNERDYKSENSVSLNEEYVRIEPGLITPLKHIHRIKELILRCAGRDTWDALQRSISVTLYSAPRLERFYLEDTEDKDGSEFDHIDISENILCSTGSLWQLELFRCSVDWSSHTLLRCSLTHLKLFFLEDQFIPTAKVFVATLKAMPELHVLELHMSFPTSKSWVSETLRILNLQNLHIKAPSLDLVGFFRHFTFPPTCAVQIVFLDDDEVDGSEFVRSYLNAGSDITFRTLTLKPWPHSGGGILVKLFTQEGKELWMRKEFSRVARLEFEYWHAYLFHQWQVIFTKLIPQISDSEINLCDIECVYLSSTFSLMMPEVLAEAIGRFPTLRTVVGKGPGVQTLLDAMRVLPQARAPMSPTMPSMNSIIDGVYFPNVTSLYFHGVAFVEQSLSEE
ncbi:hypothetical protein BDN70DRAFT_923694 [Pholiota conissans]|uniref:F-box domain-containing protein n=1 Tax=Pholiota conissans TaxID=109636 RepID=A0A9P6CX43_9AGAR|nr:hypothetical protein BDN70DRAFT_923694 [Pholiota conissans]